MGFDGAPRVLAADATTDTLTYIDGAFAATPPLLEEVLTDAGPGQRRRLCCAATTGAVASFDPAW